MKARSQTVKAISIIALLVLLGSADALAGERRGTQRTEVTRISGRICSDTVAFVHYVIDAAERRHCSTIIFEIDADGGTLADAVRINKLISSAPFRTIAFIDRRATGAAALIPLSCEYVVMARGATWGDAPASVYTDKVSIREARAEFRLAAKIWDRDADIAESMVQGNRGVRGRALTLFPSAAVELGYADFVADTETEVLNQLGIAGKATRIEPGWWTTVVRILVNPWLTILLLAIGVSLLIREAMTWNTFGVTGTLGVALVIIVLLANIACGGHWIGIALLALGVLAFLAEIYVTPGLGIWTLIGVVCVFLGIFFGMGGGRENILPDVVGALVTSIVGLIAFFACLPQTKSWRKLIESSSEDRDLGIVAPNEFTGYFGVVGLALTDLRPKGLASFAGMRVDVVADGEYIRQGTSIEVTRIDSGAIYVRPTEPATPKKR